MYLVQNCTGSIGVIGEMAEHQLWVTYRTIPQTAAAEQYALANL